MNDITRELMDQVARAREAGTTLAIAGGGSKRFMGREVGTDGVINVGDHNGIVGYEPVELVLTARAGTPLREIDAALAEHGQMLAFDPPHFDGSATMGGALACNQSGPSRPWYGSVRDAVLGIRLINGRGEHLRFGGQVMKNVAGYDVSRAQAGALGILGVITEVSLKVMPRPECCVTLVQEMDASSAIHRMNTLGGQPRPLAGACWYRGNLYLRLAGVASAVEATAVHWGGEIMAAEDVFWRQLRDQHLPFFAGDAPLWRFSVKSSVPHWRSDVDWLIDWGGAQRWWRGELDPLTLQHEADGAGGQATLYRHGNRTGEVFPTLHPGVQRLHRRLKDTFDPGRVFNPGRLYSWL